MDLKQVNEHLKTLSQTILDLENSQKRFLKIVEGMDKKINALQFLMEESSTSMATKNELEDLQQEFESLKTFTGFYGEPEE